MGKRSRDKGSRVERAIVNSLKASGITAERVPLSGGAGGSFIGDIRIDFGMGEKLLEVKARAVGFKQIYDWLGSNFGLVVKADRSEPLLVIRLKDAAEIATKLDGGKHE